MRDAGAELKQDPGAEITDPGGHVADPWKGISDLLHKAQALFRCHVLVLCVLFLNAQILIFLIAKDVGCTLLIYQAVLIPISDSPPISVSAVCTRKVLFSSSWHSFALKIM